MRLLAVGFQVEAEQTSQTVSAPAYDLDKLARVVAQEESGSCTSQVALSKKNCHGIMTWYWKDGVRHRTAKTFNSFEESYADFKRIWSTYYGRFPDKALAEKYTSSGEAALWLSNVTKIYYE